MKNFTIVLLLVLTGCYSTPYGPIEKSDTGGYYHTKISDSNYTVGFAGNGFTSGEQANKYALKRALEIGKELNYKYMVVNGLQDESGTEKIQSPSFSQTQGTFSNGSFQSNTINYNNQPPPIHKPEIIINVNYFDGTPTGRHLKIYEIEQELLLIDSE